MEADSRDWEASASLPRRRSRLASIFVLLTAAVVCAQADYSVHDFGAVGDGKTDDTAAFSAIAP